MPPIPGPIVPTYFNYTFLCRQFKKYLEASSFVTLLVAAILSFATLLGGDHQNLFGCKRFLTVHFACNQHWRFPLVQIWNQQMARICHGRFPRDKISKIYFLPIFTIHFRFRIGSNLFLYQNVVVYTYKTPKCRWKV